MNHAVLASLNPEQVEAELWRADELAVRRRLSSELDEIGSYVARKSNPRWLWHGIDHRTGKVLAYVFGRRKDEVFLKLTELLEPFGITTYDTDGWGAYERHIDAEKHQHQSTNADEAVSAPHDLLFEDGTDSRFGNWAVRQSLCIWPSSLTRNQQI